MDLAGQLRGDEIHLKHIPSASFHSIHDGQVTHPCSGRAFSPSPRLWTLINCCFMPCHHLPLFLFRSCERCTKILIPCSTLSIFFLYSDPRIPRLIFGRFLSWLLTQAPLSRTIFVKPEDLRESRHLVLRRKGFLRTPFPGSLSSAATKSGRSSNLGLSCRQRSIVKRSPPNLSNS